MLLSWLGSLLFTSRAPPAASSTRDEGLVLEVSTDTQDSSSVIVRALVANNRNVKCMVRPVDPPHEMRMYDSGTGVSSFSWSVAARFFGRRCSTFPSNATDALVVDQALTELHSVVASGWTTEDVAVLNAMLCDSGASPWIGGMDSPSVADVCWFALTQHKLNSEDCDGIAFLMHEFAGRHRVQNWWKHARAEFAAPDALQVEGPGDSEKDESEEEHEEEEDEDSRVDRAEGGGDGSGRDAWRE